jgi:PAS domain S-box-containing protein
LRTAPASPDGRRSRVVIADDNADMRDYLQRLLSDAGYAVQALADGQEALAAVRRNPPDLVLSDVMMPDLDGFALLKGIRADPLTTAVPVLLLSARAGEEATVEGLEAGADDYLIKPFTARELLARISANIALARLRRDAAAREQELRRQIEEILDRISDAFYAVDRELRVVYANRRLEELIQQPREELIGQRIGDIFPNAWEGDWESYRRRFAAVGDALAARFESFSEALGAWIEGTIYRSDTGYSVYLQDVSGRRRIEEELRRATGQAEAVALASTNLLAAASRDLRQPLDVIMRDIFQVAAQNPEHRQGLFQARRAAGRLASALDKLTELAQLVSGAREPQRRSFLIRELFDQIKQTWAPAAGERRVHFDLPNSEELVHSDPQMLATMLHNLVGNAIGYTERGRVWVECRRRDDMVAIEVHDTGIGIPGDKLDDIFKEFQRLHPCRSEGMGLGLAIVRRMADLLGHEIAVQSVPGEGSCFQIEVPAGSWRYVLHTRGLSRRI